MTVAVVFPGQGSQVPASGSTWTDEPSWALVERISEAAGIDVAHLLLDADADELVDTANAQLSTFAICLVIHGALVRGDEVPVALYGGHSLGEYTALVAAGVLTVEDGARLVAGRGAAMRHAAAVNVGTMAAIIGLDPDQVRAACDGAGGDVWVANDNAPGQVVIAGSSAAIAAAGVLAVEAGARRPMPLAVAGAFHTPYMAPAADDLAAAIGAATFVAPPPGVHVFSNVDAAAHDDPADWPALLATQLCAPVRWRDQISAMSAAGADVFVEAGPGTVLTGMVKRIEPGATRVHGADPDEVAVARRQLQNRR